MNVPLTQLRDTFSIPQIGLGLWQVKDFDEFNTAFNAAVMAGYRHFDSAQIYRNEQMLGDAWTQSGLKREEFFITTKISVKNFGAKHTISSFKTSLEKLKTDYVDLLLLHFPVALVRKKSWLALEKLQAEGKVRSIGVSNYTVRHLKEMKAYANVVPAVNQVELHVFLQQPELIEYCHINGIIIEAYSPLAHARNMTNQTIKNIAAKHNKTYAQIMLRWCLERNLVVLPKSITPIRIKENIDIFDFVLDRDDLKKLAQLNKNLRTCWDPTLVP